VLTDDGRTTTMDVQRLALTGLLAPVVLVVGVVAAGLTWPEYRHRAQNISDLGGTEAPYPAILNVALVLFGLLVVAFGVALHRATVERAPSRAGPWLVGYFGVMAVVQGLTPCTSGCAGGTPVDLVHGLAAMTGVVAVAIAMLGFRRAARTVAGWELQRRLSAWTAVLTLGLLVAWLVAAGVDPEGLRAGVLQRAVIAVVLLWLVVTSVGLRQADRARPLAPATGLSG
jgi:hypothetical membrane protein